MDTGNFRGFTVELRDEGIILITFNRPDRLNALVHETKRELCETITQAQMDDAVRVLVFTGQGNAFCAGDDISGKDAQFADALDRVPKIPRGARTPIRSFDSLRTFSQPVNTALRNLDKLCISAINGYAIQSGLSIALASDFRIASTNAKLGSATLRFAYLPDEGGHYLLVQLMGVAKAMDFLMRNRIVSAQEALELGLVHEVTEPGELMERTMALATELANGPQVAMRLLKRAIYNAADYTMAQAMDDIASKTAISDHHPDAKEGGDSFRERRKPSFNQDLP